MSHFNPIIPKDEKVAPYNPFPNNDISALDEGRFDYPSSNGGAKIHDRSGNVVAENAEDTAQAGGRIILACLDFNREDHLAVCPRARFTELPCPFHSIRR